MRTFDVEVTTTVTVTVNDEDAIARAVDNHAAPSIAHPEARWQDQYWPVADECDVIRHFAFNAVANAVDDASSLDGWADLERDAVTMQVGRDMDLYVRET